MLGAKERTREAGSVVHISVSVYVFIHVRSRQDNQSVKTLCLVSRKPWKDGRLKQKWSVVFPQLLTGCKTSSWAFLIKPMFNSFYVKLRKQSVGAVKPHCNIPLEKNMIRVILNRTACSSSDQSCFHSEQSVTAELWVWAAAALKPHRSFRKQPPLICEPHPGPSAPSTDVNTANTSAGLAAGAEEASRKPGFLGTALVVCLAGFPHHHAGSSARLNQSVWKSLCLVTRGLWRSIPRRLVGILEASGARCKYVRGQNGPGRWRKAPFQHRLDCFLSSFFEGAKKTGGIHFSPPSLFFQQTLLRWSRVR